MDALNGKDPKFAGLIIPSHRVQNTDTKKRAEDTLFGYQFVSYTAPEWIEQLENGRTIIPGAFSPKTDGTYTHAEKYWTSTIFILCDADHIKGVEFDDNGNDKFPNGIEPWTEDGQLSIKFPDLLKEAYAVGQSVSSMGDRFDKAHRRYRIIFHFDKPITCGKHYRQIELALAAKYPIIPPIARQPAQPTFGNAREGYNKYHITGNILKLDDFPYIDPEPKASSSKTEHKPTEQILSLREYLDKHNISYTADTKSDTRYPDRHFVKCPHSNKHTDSICREKDAFTWDDGKGFAFYCSHASCGQNTWEQFKTGYGIKSAHGGSRAKAGRKSNIEKAKEAQPVKSQKPIVMLNEIIDNDEGKDVLSDKSRDEVSNEVASVIFKSSKDDNFFRRDTELGSLKADNDSLRFNAYTKEGIAGVIVRQTSLQKYRDGDIVKVANPPSWLASDILENQDTSKLPAIDIILTHPYHNGKSLIIEDGFDPNTGAYLNQKKKELDLDLDKHSAKDDIQLWRDWLCDFPFESESDFENAIGYMLTIMIRPGLPIGEVSPMFLITAPREGVGKTLLADVLTAAVTGIPTENRTLGSKNDEIKKELGAALRTAPEVVVFDNVESSKRLDSAVLASVVTQVRGRFRILGVSEEMSYDNRSTMLYTGSNIELTIELVKRAAAIRLEDTGIAEKDRKVKVENILSETLRRHTEFISSLTRMVKRWIESEKETTEPLHRMRQWSKDIFSILKANNLGEHFLKNTDEVMLTTGDEFTTWSNAFKAIAESLGKQATEGFTAADVFTILSHEDNVYSPEDSNKQGETVFGEGENILGEYVTGHKDQSRKISLGKLLRSKTGAIYGGYKLIDTHQSRSGGKKIYRLEPVEGQTVPRIPGSEPELNIPEPENPVNINSDCPF